MLRDLGKLIVAKALKSCPKSNKLPNLVTLLSECLLRSFETRKICHFEDATSFTPLEAPPPTFPSFQRQTTFSPVTTFSPFK